MSLTHCSPINGAMAMFIFFDSYSKDCPIGHKIRFLACYEIKEWKTIKRNITWGVFTITMGEADSK